MHTDSSLELLSEATKTFGHAIREFQEKTCVAFTTHELDRERATRLRRQERKPASVKPGHSNSDSKKSSNVKQPKQFNLKTYKFHALGDYYNAIKRFGTTDSYTTQPVGLPS
jgi:hypothetical protein